MEILKLKTPIRNHIEYKTPKGHSIGWYLSLLYVIPIGLVMLGIAILVEKYKECFNIRSPLDIRCKLEKDK